VTSRRQFLRLAIGAGSAALLAACGRAAGSSPASTAGRAPAKLTMGYLPNITHAPALVAVAQDGFAEAMPGVTIAYKTFNAGPALIEAVFANAVDIGYVGPSPAVNGYHVSKGQALRIIAGAMSGGASLVSRPAASIKTAADLAGKKIASPQLGNTQDVTLRWYLQQHGLKTRDKGGSVDVVPAQNPDIVNLFRQNQIDGAWVPEPWASMLVLKAGGETFIDERTLWPGGQFSSVCLLATPRVLAGQPEAVQGVLRAHLAAIDYIGQQPEQAKTLAGDQLAKLTSQPVPSNVLDRSFGMQEATYDPLAATILAGAEHAFALGFLGSSTPDLAKLFDFGPLNAALAGVGLPSVAAA
jgi:NitT/TauT family transport system substrate-binding protein